LARAPHKISRKLEMTDIKGKYFITNSLVARDLFLCYFAASGGFAIAANEKGVLPMFWAKCFVGVQEALSSIRGILAIIGIEDDQIFDRSQDPIDFLSVAFREIKAADGGLRGGQGPPILHGSLVDFVTEVRREGIARYDISEIPDWALCCYYVYEAIEADKSDMTKSEEWTKSAREVYRQMYKSIYGESHYQGYAEDEAA